MKLEGTRVLLVEDNPADARLLREALVDVGAGGIDMVHVTRLQSGLDLLSRQQFDLVLLDLSLPDGTGLETLTRAHEHAPGVPIVVLTGFDDEGLAIRSLRLGAQDYLVKGQTDGNLLVRSMRYAAERKHAVEALQRREEHFRSLIENALDLITIVSDDGIIRYVSPSHERVLGFRPEELIGGNITALLHDDDAIRFMPLLRSAESPASLEARFRHRNGAWRLLECFGRNLSHVPGVHGMVINSRDVTERKAAEEAMRAANTTLSAVIRTSPLAIYTTDTQGCIRSWNAAAQRMFGWAEWEILGQSLPHIPESEAPLVEQMRQQIREGSPARTLETQCRTRDERLLNVQIWSGLLRDANGLVTGTVEMVADVTEQRRMEAQLNQSHKMEAIGRLAGGIAHDFNNLLMVIQGYTQMLITTVQPGDAAAEDLEQIMRASERAGDLTRRLLAFSRRQVVQPRTIDINTLVHDTERMLHRVIGAHIDLVTELCPIAPTVRADPGQMEQVLLNLALNARDAMPGGGRLTIRTALVHLDEDAARRQLLASGDYAILSVSDTGIGIDSETRSHLFEPFFTTKERGKGTGLGLSTSYGIVKQNGGDIRVDSQPGSGATFDIYLPVTPTDPEGTALAPVRSGAGTETILVVEDEPGVRHVVDTMLRKQGYNVLSCSTPEEALEVAATYARPINLLVTDIMMPHINGIDLAARVSSQRPDIRLLFMSGYTGTSTEMDMGGECLQKPFSAEALAAKVREVLSADTPAAAQ